MTTWNPADLSNVTLSNGNLTATTSNSAAGVRSTTSKNSGTWYYEVTNLTNLGLAVGVADSTWTESSPPGESDAKGSSYQGNGPIWANSGVAGVGASYTTNDVISIAVDVTHTLIYFAKNGVWQNSANPVLGTGGVNYVTTNPVFAALSSGGSSGSMGTANFGPSNFAFTPPSGFYAWDLPPAAPTGLVSCEW
jgi:hypothetical protein